MRWTDTGIFYVFIRLLCLWLLLAITISQPGRADELTELLTGTKEESVASDKVITTDSSRQEDEKIRQRLQEIFAELEALQNIKIAVNKGVITLTGEVGSAANEAKALQFSRQVEGVVEVENELTVSRSLKKRLNSTADKLWALSKQIVLGLPLFLIALLVVVLAWLAGRWLSKRRFYQYITPNQFIANLFRQITHLIFIILGIMLALILLDATALIGTILGAAGIIGLAVGFAVRDTVENYIASILLSLRNPFHVNDLVSINGHQGNVLRLTSRATLLISADGNHIRLPNSMVFKAVITNFTRHPERRFQFDVSVDSAQDLLALQVSAMKSLKATTGVLDDPKPLVVIEQLEGAKVLLRIYAWINQEEHGYAKVRSEAIRAVKLAIDEYCAEYSGDRDDMGGPSEPKLNVQKRPDREVAPKPVEPEVVTEDAEALGVRDVSADLTVEKRVIEERAEQGGENLLNDDAPHEL